MNTTAKLIQATTTDTDFSICVFQHGEQYIVTIYDNVTEKHDIELLTENKEKALSKMNELEKGYTIK